jgi:cytochrome c-type biogenesis protein CcmE
MSKNTKIILGVVVVVAALGICRFLVGLGMLGTSVLFGIESSANSSVQYFITVSELMNEKDKMLNKPVRVSGAVIGDSIMFDEASGTLSFLVADVPADYEEVEQQGGLVAVLENAVNDPARQRIEIVYVGEKPELLRNMSQAIMTGELHSDGRFYAEELLLRCPSRYEEAVPDQAVK